MLSCGIDDEPNVKLKTFNPDKETSRVVLLILKKKFYMKVFVLPQGTVVRIFGVFCSVYINPSIGKVYINVGLVSSF